MVKQPTTTFPAREIPRPLDPSITHIRLPALSILIAFHLTTPVTAARIRPLYATALTLLARCAVVRAFDET